MRSAPARLLGVHAIHGDAARPWLPPRLAMRIVPDPALGFPIGPFAVSFAKIESPNTVGEIAFLGHGPGWRSDGEIHGVAWLTLLTDPTLGQPGLVELTGDIPDGVAISVVRGPGDLGPGIATRRAAPYVLSAPRVRYLRVTGRCRLNPAVATAFPTTEFVGDTRPLGLPLGRIADNVVFPQYLGVDDGEHLAWERVKEAAPEAFAPHERPLAPGDPKRPVPSPSDEVARVVALVDNWIRDALVDRIKRPVKDRLIPVALPTVVSQPPIAATATGDMDSYAALLATASDPGIGRWLGLAAVADASLQDRFYAVTVAGRWALLPGLLANIAGASSDHSSVAAMLEAASLGDQLDPHLFSHDHVVVDLWGQAIIDAKAPPDPPDAPDVAAESPAFWTIAGGADTARIPLTLRRTVPLGQIGLGRIETSGEFTPLMPTIQNAPDRRRPFFATEGTSVSESIVSPSDGELQYRAWQADLFGRWSGPADASVAAPEHPSLPKPEPIVHVLPVETIPAPGVPFRASIRVTVPVPPRVAGQPAIIQVSAVIDGAPAVQGVVGPKDVIFENIPGPAMAPATQVDATLTVMFVAVGTTSESTTRLTLTDPRPPTAPAIPPVLHFTERPDAAGVVTVLLPLPEDPRIESWEIYLTTESRLRRAGIAGPDPSLERDRRAAAWMDAAETFGREVFDCLTTPPLSASARRFRTTLPGDLAEVVMYRLVPRGPGGGASPFSSCPIIPVAVPFSIAPARPDVKVVGSMDPPVVTVTARAGRVTASQFRVRLARAADRNVRTATIVAEGQLGVDGRIEVTLPALRPFAKVSVVAEVRGVEELGNPPTPGVWGPPSVPVEFVAVPQTPTQLITAATAIERAGDVRVAVTIEGLPDQPFPGPFAVRLYRRSAAGQSPRFVADFPIGHEPSASAVAGASWLVALVDPLGRAAPPVEVVGP